MTRVRAPRCNFLRTVGTRATAYPPREPLEGLRGGGSTLTVEDIKTKPFEGQKPGTSGLRKKVTVFQEPGYLENFVQAIFDTNPSLKGQTLVLGGDGRYLNKYASLRIVRMAAANGIARVITMPDFLASTPAISHLIRQNKAKGAIILTASHNPGGPKEDFGIKYNTENGGPAPNDVTDAIYKQTTKIEGYHIVGEELDMSRFEAPGSFQVGDMTVEVVDAIDEYSKLMQSIFDFPKIRSRLFARKDFSMVFDAMHGVAGPFARRIFTEDLGAPESSILNAEALEDFGGGHPDPNLKYADLLCQKMGLGAYEGKKLEGKLPDFGAAADGDADRNMVTGSRFFVTPSDSLAIIAANAKESIPYFKDGLKGVARSMPTSGAVDTVAEKLGLSLYEVPTGWKFFGNLMDAGEISLCGEESFGTGSDHIREKDGIWAVLAWLSILAHKNPDPSQPLVSVEQIVKDHWGIYGRSFYTRYDYEGVNADKANALMDNMVTSFDELKKTTPGLKIADEFSYTDPIDGSVASKQGVRFVFDDNSRLIFRLSGTGSVGATIRMYIEAVAPPSESPQDTKASDALKPLVELGLRISRMQDFTGRDEPTVIT